MAESRCGILCGECTYREQMGCKGCTKIDKPFWGEVCPVKSCCEGHGLEHCGQCREFPCGLLNQFAYDEQQGDEGKRIRRCNEWAKQEGTHMKFMGPLLAVKDVAVSRRFYEEVLGQKVGMDFGENVSFVSGFSIQLKPHYANMIHLDDEKVVLGSNSTELYFEEDDIEGIAARFTADPSVELLHGMEEAPWMQRSIRLYDPDRYIIEIGESMEAVLRRCAKEGMSAEEIAQRTGYPLLYIQQITKG